MHLEKAAVGALIPQLAIDKPKDDVELQRLKTDEAQNEESETYEFQWQEKVFCQVQIRLGDIDCCSLCMLPFAVIVFVCLVLLIG